MEVAPRSTLNPVSLNELSIQDKSIRLEEIAVAEREPGIAGIVASVVAPLVFE